VAEDKDGHLNPFTKFCNLSGKVDTERRCPCCGWRGFKTDLQPFNNRPRALCPSGRLKERPHPLLHVGHSLTPEKRHVAVALGTHTFPRKQIGHLPAVTTPDGPSRHL